MKKTLILFIFVLLMASCNKNKAYHIVIYTQKLSDDESAKFDDNIINLLSPIVVAENLMKKTVYSPFIDKGTVELYRLDYPDKKNVFKIDLADNMLSTENNIIKKTKSGLEELKVGQVFILPNQSLHVDILLKHKDKIFVFDPNANAADSVSILGINYAKYSDIEQLKDALKESIRKQIEKGNNLKNFAILYNVNLNPIGVIKPIDTTSQPNDTIVAVSTPSIPPPPKPEKPKNNSASYVPPSTSPSSNCIDQIKPSTNELTELVALIANKSIDACRKTKLKGYLSNYFTSDAEIVTVTNNCGENITYNVSQLYSVLLNSGKSLFIQSQCKEETEMVGNKYRKVPVQIIR